MGERISSVQLDDVLVSAVPPLAQLWPDAVAELAAGTLPDPDTLRTWIRVTRLRQSGERRHLLVCPALRRQVQKRLDHYGSVMTYDADHLVDDVVGTACRTCARRAVTSAVTVHVLMVGWFVRATRRIERSAHEVRAAWATGRFARLSEAGRSIQTARSELAQARQWAARDTDPDAAGALDALDTLLDLHSESLAAALADTGLSAGQRNAQRCAVVRGVLTVASLSMRIRIAERRGDANILRGADHNWGAFLLTEISAQAARWARGNSGVDDLPAAAFVAELVGEPLRTTVTRALADGPDRFDQIPPVLEPRVGDVSVAAWMRTQWDTAVSEHLGALAAEVGGALARVLDGPAPLYRVTLSGEAHYDLNRWLGAFDVTAGPDQQLTGALVPAALAQAALAIAAGRPKMTVTATVADPSFDQMHLMVTAMGDDLKSETLLWTDRYQAAADACGVDLGAAVTSAFPDQAHWPGT